MTLFKRLRIWKLDLSNGGTLLSRLKRLMRKKKSEEFFHGVCHRLFSSLACHKINFKKQWHILKSDPELAQTFKDLPPFVNKRGKNMKDLLVHTDCIQHQSTGSIQQTLLSPLLNGKYRCGNCGQCNNTYKTNFFPHTHTNKMFRVNSVITCASTQVVYTLRCPCGLMYVGKTTRKLKQHIGEHKNGIHWNDRDYPAAVHFNFEKRDTSTLGFCGVEKISLPFRGGELDLLLGRREAYCIFTLQTLSPRGLNDDLPLNVML